MSKLVQRVVSVPLAPSLEPLDPDSFLAVALKGLTANAGKLTVAKGDCEGFSVPGLPWNAPFNQALFVLQRECRSLGWAPPQVLGAVFRFSALCSPVVQDPLVREFLDLDPQGNITALDEFLIRAAATSPVTLNASHKACFVAAELAAQAAHHRALRWAQVAERESDGPCHRRSEFHQDPTV